MAIRIDADEGYSRSSAFHSNTTFTVAMWLSLSTDRNAASRAWETWENTTNYGRFGTTADGTSMQYQEAGGTAAPSLTGPSLTVGDWYWMCVAKAGTSVTLYYAAATATSLSTSSHTDGEGNIGQFAGMRIGRGQAASTQFDGRIAAVKIWTTVALSAAEVQQEWWMYRPSRTANLHHWHPFLVAETTDYSGGGRTLTLDGTVSTEDGPPLSWGIPIDTPLDIAGAAPPAGLLNQRLVRGVGL